MSRVLYVYFNTSAETCFQRGKIVIMTNTKYPRICIRLSPTMKRRITIVAKSRNVSQARIIREALTKHFVGSEMIDSDI